MQHLSWEKVKKENVNEKLSRRLAWGERAMIAQLFLAKGCLVPTHQHESEQLSMIMQGSLKFELEGREVIVRAGDVLVIPSHVPHSALALEDSLAYDVFSPIRQDWLDGTDTYLRK